MNASHKCLLYLAMLTLAASGLLGQGRILSDATAVAGGATAGAAVGEQIGKRAPNIFDKVNKSLGAAAATGEMTRKRPVLLDSGEEPLTTESEISSPDTKPADPAPRKARAKAKRPDPEPTVYMAPGFNGDPAPQPTKGDLETLENGLEREKLVARLGWPSARVLIPEDGMLKEVYLFSGGGHHLGAVELEDGAVSRVRVNSF